MSLLARCMRGENAFLCIDYGAEDRLGGRDATSLAVDVDW